jgi:putative phosphoesterase
MQNELHVLVTSDTHVHNAAALPAGLLALAERAEHIVHAGDLSVYEVVTVLEQFAPVTAVHGNVESADSFARLTPTAFATVAGVKVGVVHDAGPAPGRHERIARTLPDCDVRVYGHSHQPEIAQVADGSWIVNPGSPCQRRRAPFHSCAWMHVRDGAVASIDLGNLDAR